VDPLTATSLIAANIASMGPADWAALLFATCVASLAIVGELKVPCVLSGLSMQGLSLEVSCPWLTKGGRCEQDITLCAIAITHAGDRLTRGSRIVLALLGGVRRWVFLPTLVLVVSWLVMFKGGDALSVCFNTIAILFLTEVPRSETVTRPIVVHDLRSCTLLLCAADR
jgi:hypothetical protein